MGQLAKQIEEDIIFDLGGGIVEVELKKDDQIQRAIDMSLREIQRYIDLTKYATLPYMPCIDLSKVKVYAVVDVMRATPNSNLELGVLDPFAYVGSGAGMASGSWDDYRVALQAKSLMANVKTDMQFVWDSNDKKLYVQYTTPHPDSITIQYIPQFETVDEVKDAYWIDEIRQMATSHCKIALGRARGKYTLNNALWSLDAAIGQEGREELTAQRERLRANHNTVLPLD